MHIYPNSMKNVERQHEGDLVDIIMRTKDRNLLLRRALNSVLNQSYQNWHLYLVNDGGDKEKLETLLTSYKKDFKGQLTLIHNNKSLGREAATNCALKQSQGDFVAVHDDDDRWHPKFLEKTTTFLKDKKNFTLVAVSTQTSVVCEEHIGNNIFEKTSYPLFPGKAQIFYQDNLKRSTCSPLISLLIRKDAIKKIGFFNETMPVGGDWDYNKRLIQIGDIGFIPEVLAFYHKRNQNDKAERYQKSVSAIKNDYDQYIIQQNALIRHTLNQSPELIGLFVLIANQKNTLLRYEKVLEQKIQELNKLYLKK